VNKATRPSRSAAEHHEEGVALAAQRRFVDAIKEYREAARLNPNFSDTFFNLGVAYGELGQWKAAIKAYKTAIHLNPEDWQAYCNLGVDYVNSRQYAKAIYAFRRGAELNPEEMTLFVSVGYNCGRLRRYSEAIEAYSHAVRLNLTLLSVGTTSVSSTCTNVITMMRSTPPKEHWPSIPIMTNPMQSSEWHAENPAISMMR
jgi:tetratricopeptide (TPR) repeat protein